MKKCLGKPEKLSLHVHPGRACGNQDYCQSVPMVGATQVWCTNKDDLSLRATCCHQENSWSLEQATLIQDAVADYVRLGAMPSYCVKPWGTFKALGVRAKQKWSQQRTIDAQG